MTGNTLVSIIVPLYNKEQHIRDMMTSVISQTIPNWEMWIVDNQSTDNSVAVAKQFQDERINLIVCPLQTGGPGAPRNFGVKHAQGDWVLFLDADDTLEPTHLGNLLADVRANPKADIIAGHWQEYTDASPGHRILKAPAGYGAASDSFPDGAIAFAPWAVHAAIVKRSILASPFLWIEELDPYLSEDTAFWFRLVSNFPVAYSNNRGALYRKETINNRNQDKNPEKWFLGLNAVIESNLEFHKQCGKELSVTHCESLMRFYSGIYLLENCSENIAASQDSLSIAKFWLSKCVACEGKKSISVLVRYLIGLEIFLFLKLLFKRRSYILVRK